jgi:hypothetical protein
MCWQYDAESWAEQSAAENVSGRTLNPIKDKSIGGSIKLTDVELLVGNLYPARKSPAAPEVADATSPRI